MTLKKHFAFLGDEKCRFCNLNVYDVLYGPIYKSRQTFERKYIVVHYYCLLMASEIKQNGKDNQGILGFFSHDIIRELSRGKSMRCSYCGSLGATVSCVNNGCQKIFHLPCGIKNGSVHQFFDMFKSFCHLHRPNQSLPKGIMRTFGQECIICCSEIDKQNKYHSIWPICCKPNAFFHRKCVQKMADNAGYYFKCPLCNNKDTFKEEMQKVGIYVPDQDASWELEPQAFEELNIRGSGCEAESCLCPQGINYSRKHTAWQLELCKVCGGNGTHLGCTKRWNRRTGYHFNWFCEICKPVYLENRCSKTPDRTLQDEAVPSISNTSPTLKNDDASISTILHLHVPPSQTNAESHQTSTESDEDGSNDEKDIKEMIASTSGVLNSTERNCDEVMKEEDSEDDEIIMVISDDENAENVPTASVEAEAVVDKSETESQASDDCEFVQVISSKRKKKEFIPAKKKFRTAHWSPPEDEKGFTSQTQVSRINMTTTLPQVTSPPVGERGLTSQAQVSRINMTTPLPQLTSHNGDVEKSASHKVRSVEGRCSSTKVATTSISHPDRPMPEKLESSTLSESTRQILDSTPPSKMVLHPGHNPVDVPSRQSKNDLYLPSINFNLKEVSINRLVSKPSLPKRISEHISVIDLSSDDEDAPTQQSRDSGKPVNLVNQSSVFRSCKPPTHLYNLLSKTDNREGCPKSGGSAVSSQVDKCVQQRLSNEISKNMPHKTELCNPERILKSRKPTLIYHILSSDDEEIEMTPSKIPVKATKTVEPRFNSIKNNVNNSLPFECQSITAVNDNNTQNNLSKIYRKSSSESDSIEEVTLNTKPTQPPLSILPGALSILKKNTIKPDVLILSDDDDDNDLQMEKVHNVKNILTSEKKLPVEVTEQPIPTRVILTKDICSAAAIDVDRESPVSPPDTISPQSPVLVNGNNSFGIIINEVISLAHGSFMADPFEDEEEYVTIEKIEQKSECLSEDREKSVNPDFNHEARETYSIVANVKRIESIKSDGDSLNSFYSEQMVSSTVPLCSCIVSCLCNITNDTISMNNTKNSHSERKRQLVSAEDESVTSTTDSCIPTSSNSTPPSE